MDELVVGHSDVKTALLLGIIREHIYIQGPLEPKTMLSEIVSKSVNLISFFIKCTEIQDFQSSWGLSYFKRRYKKR